MEERKMTLNKHTKLSRTLMGCALGMGLVLAGVPTANAEKVQSDSQYDIDIAVLQGSCDSDSSFANNFASSIVAAGKDKKSSFLDKFGNALNSASYAQKGCTKTGVYVLNSKDSMTVNAGQWIIASKEKGNPWPAICKIPRGKTVILKTIKSDKLRKTFGFSGDAGLKCEIN
jgi:hypothetical protein